MTNYWYPKLGVSGGGGTVGPGTSPQHAYFSGPTTVLSDANMQKGVQGTELRAISFLLATGVTDQYYVSTTGNDSNAGTIGAPFLTVARGIRQWAANSRPGNCVLNLAAGTYNEQITAPAFMGNSDSGLGPSVLKIVGSDPTDPSLTVINFNGGTPFKSYGTSVITYFDGVTFTSDETGTDSIGVDIRQSMVVLENVDFSGNKTGIKVSASGLCYFLPNANGGNIDAQIDGITIDNGTFICAAELNISGNRDSGIECRNNGVVEITSDVSTFTAGGVPCKRHFYINSGGILKIANDMTLELSDANTGFDSVSFRLDSGTVIMGANCTVNMTDDSQPGYFTGASIWKSEGTSVFNYLGTTSNNWFIGDNSTVANPDNFTTGVINTAIATGMNYGLDWRFLNSYSGVILGAVPSFATRYLSTAGISTTYIPIYIAQSNEIVDQLEIRTSTASGAGLTDTYTLQLNGADTALVVPMADVLSNYNNSDKITLASGDSVGVKVFTDLASATTNVFATFTVRKLPD